MDFNIKDMIDEYRDSRNCCGAEEIKRYLVVRSATRGQVSDLIDNYEDYEQEVKTIKYQLDNEKKKHELLMFKDNGRVVYPDQWREEQLKLKGA